MPEMTPVDSSNVFAVGYDEDTQELHVQFTSGAVYVYADVPSATHDELMSADSVGSYLNREIKPHYTVRQD